MPNFIALSRVDSEFGGVSVRTRWKPTSGAVTHQRQGMASNWPAPPCLCQRPTSRWKRRSLHPKGRDSLRLAPSSWSDRRSPRIPRPPSTARLPETDTGTGSQAVTPLCRWRRWVVSERHRANFRPTHDPAKRPGIMNGQVFGTAVIPKGDGSVCSSKRQVNSGGCPVRANNRAAACSPPPSSPRKPTVRSG